MNYFCDAGWVLSILPTRCPKDVKYAATIKAKNANLVNYKYYFRIIPIQYLPIISLHLAALLCRRLSDTVS